MTALAPLFVSKFAVPGGLISMNVVWRSRETNARLPVEKYDALSDPGIAFAARSVAALIAWLFVASPLVWKTTTLGGRTPTPNVCSVRWLASYAELPGIENDWYQRLDSCPAETPPLSVRTAQTPMTVHRRRATKWARRGSNA